ncbi:hypothetical protein [Bradyrhizobium manausense]|uniref:hypothetical protein n=1 Tax=Bradyrhizobium manausense TaxID=989370 RepID=UPI000B19D7A2|nr:hypothetical protein [Bradyrhizobium manausense]
MKRAATIFGTLVFNAGALAFIGLKAGYPEIALTLAPIALAVTVTDLLGSGTVHT